MPELLLPGEFVPSSDHSETGTYTIETLWAALCVLHVANAEGQLRCVRAWSACPTCPTVVAWGSEELRAIRDAIEEEAT